MPDLDVLVDAGFCPRCRRYVQVLTREWRPAVPARPERGLAAERGNALGRVRCAAPARVSDPAPRERPAVYAALRRAFPGRNGRRDCFARRLTPAHDCGAPTVADPTAPPRGRLDQFYDTA